MYNNDTITRVSEITNSEVEEFLDSGDIYGFYSHSRDLATAVAQDMSFLLNASERHGVTINWGNITPEDVQTLAALDRDYERALHVWGCSGFRAYARDEDHTASDDHLLAVQTARINTVVNDCIGYDENGYDRWGYDENGYDKWGYDINGWDREGLSSEGYSRADWLAGVV